MKRARQLSSKGTRGIYFVHSMTLRQRATPLQQVGSCSSTIATPQASNSHLQTRAGRATEPALLIFVFQFTTRCPIGPRPLLTDMLGLWPLQQREARAGRELPPRETGGGVGSTWPLSSGFNEPSSLVCIDCLVTLSQTSCMWRGMVVGTSVMAGGKE